MYLQTLIDKNQRVKRKLVSRLNPRQYECNQYVTQKNNILRRCSLKQGLTLVDNMCCVCQENRHCSTSLFIMGPCSHYICAGCWINIIDSDKCKRCPMCRTHVVVIFDLNLNIYIKYDSTESKDILPENILREQVIYLDFIQYLIEQPCVEFRHFEMFVNILLSESDANDFFNNLTDTTNITIYEKIIIFIILIGLLATLVVIKNIMYLIISLTMIIMYFIQPYRLFGIRLSSLIISPSIYDNIISCLTYRKLYLLSFIMVQLVIGFIIPEIYYFIVFNIFRKSVYYIYNSNVKSIICITRFSLYFCDGFRILFGNK